MFCTRWTATASTTMRTCHLAIPGPLGKVHNKPTPRTQPTTSPVVLNWFTPISWGPSLSFGGVQLRQQVHRPGDQVEEDIFHQGQKATSVIFFKYSFKRSQLKVQSGWNASARVGVGRTSVVRSRTTSFRLASDPSTRQSTHYSKTVPASLTGELSPGCLRMDSDLKTFLPGKAMKTVVYLTNRVPNAGLGNTTLYGCIFRQGGGLGTSSSHPHQGVHVETHTEELSCRTAPRILHGERVVTDVHLAVNNVDERRHVIFTETPLSTPRNLDLTGNFIGSSFTHQDQEIS